LHVNVCCCVSPVTERKLMVSQNSPDQPKIEKPNRA